MKKFLLFTVIIFFAAIPSHLLAQSINNKNWKAYLDAPINDSVTFHVHSDSSFVTNSNGDVVIRVHCTISGDTLTIVNQDPEQHGCPDQRGKYKINLKDDDLVFTLIEDACEGRSQAIHNVKWKEAAK